MTDDHRKGDRRIPPAVADFALQQLAATPMPAQDFTHDAENYGPALNEAGWTFINECPETSALLFNNTKTPLRAAILKYAELVKPATAENCDGLRAKVDEQAREIERLTREAKNDAIAYWAVIERQGELRLALAALKAQPSGVVLPERREVGPQYPYLSDSDVEWNAALDEVARLNLPPVSPVKCQTCRDSGVVSTTDKDHNGDHIEQRCPVCASDGGSRHDAVKALHDVMQAVPCASLYSLAEAVLDAGYVKTASAGDERAAFDTWFARDVWNEGCHGNPDILKRQLWPCWQARATLSANRSEQVPAWLDVLSERQRQISAEGWTPEHDDAHIDGALAKAAACYAANAGDSRIPKTWPWMAKFWKPGTTRRMLVKSGALILAEIERLDRAAAPSAGSQGGGV